MPRSTSTSRSPSSPSGGPPRKPWSCGSPCISHPPTTPPGQRPAIRARRARASSRWTPTATALPTPSCREPPTSPPESRPSRRWPPRPSAISRTRVSTAPSSTTPTSPSLAPGPVAPGPVFQDLRRGSRKYPRRPDSPFGDEVSDRRPPPADVKGVGLRLDIAVRVGAALMLAQVLDPGLDQEDLGVESVVGGVHEQAPLHGAVAQTDAPHAAHGLRELGGAGRIDLVADLHQHGTALGLELMRHDRRRPLAGRCK